MEKKKIKSVLFKLGLDGRGIVNFDDNSQKFKLKSMGVNHLYDHRENSQYAKKEFFINENGEWDYKIKISDGCLRNALFRNDYVAHMPHISKYPKLFIPYVASPAVILRGFLSTEKGKETTNRKSAVCMPSAIQTNNTQSSLEVNTRGGYREIKEDENDAKDTSLFKRENIGEIKYETKGALDLHQLQFTSADQAYGRYNINPDFFKFFAEELKKNFPNFDGKLKYYNLKYSSTKYPELGLLFSEDDIKFLMKEFIKRVLDIKIQRSGAYAILESLEVKFVYDPITDKLNDEDGWIKINTIEEFENLISDESVEIFYEEADYEDSLATQSKLKELIKDSKESRRKEKEIEKEEKDKAKKEKERLANEKKEKEGK